MTGAQVVFVAAAFVILLAITAAAQFRWIRHRTTRLVLVFTSGVAVVASLWLAGLPPDWFAGSKSGFGIALSLLLGAFVARSDNERTSFGAPLLLGMSITLLAANVAAFVGSVS